MIRLKDHFSSYKPQEDPLLFLRSSNDQMPSILNHSSCSKLFTPGTIHVKHCWTFKQSLCISLITTLNAYDTDCWTSRM